MQRRTSEDVVEELKRRSAEGRSLRSGDNRGDWLYAAAINRFGSWQVAIEAAGFDYDQIVSRPLTHDEVLDQLRSLASEGDALIPQNHKKLQSSACRHFGSWRGAVEAAGLELPDRRKWSPDVIIKRLREEIQRGLPMGANAARRRDENLYMAARRRFGSWKAAVEAAKKKPSKGDSGGLKVSTPAPSISGK